MGGIDFTPLISAIPIWTFVGIAVKYWVDKSRETAKEFRLEIDARFKSIQEDLKISGYRMGDAVERVERIMNDIKLELADSGVGQLKATLEMLKESRIRSDMKIDAAFRNIDELKAALKS